MTSFSMSLFFSSKKLLHPFLACYVIMPPMVTWTPFSRFQTTLRNKDVKVFQGIELGGSLEGTAKCIGSDPSFNATARPSTSAWIGSKDVLAR